MKQDFWIFFQTVLALTLSELSDKSFIIGAITASSSNHKVAIYWAIVVAHVIAVGMAIGGGILLSKWANIKILKAVSGIIFILFGLWFLLKR